MSATFNYCLKHRNSTSTAVSGGWLSDRLLNYNLPCVSISVKDLSGRIHSLLDAHGGVLPISTLVDCYNATFPHAPLDTRSKPSVHLEHLISAIRGIEVSSTSDGFKYIQWMDQSSSASTTSSSESTSLPMQIKPEVTCNIQHSPKVTSLTNSSRNSGNGNSSNTNNSNSNSNNNVSIESTGSQEENTKPTLDDRTRLLLVFAREVRGLLRCQPGCTISFGKFVPAYHSHFGKQCCVYVYGYNKLIELLEAIPNVVQILGHQKYITLTHREQVKRFSSELTRILRSRKSQDKKLLVTQVADAYESFYSKPFDLANYGVCTVEDLLNDIWDGGLQLTRANDGTFVSIEIPRKEQSSIEKIRTRTFASEVVELLKTTPNLAIPFSKFIPMYHHYFRRQCRVSDYGFAKLADLFEAISPSTVEVVGASEPDEDEIIVVAQELKSRILFDRLSVLVRGYKGNMSLDWSKLLEMYQAMYGHKLTPEDISSIKTSPLELLGGVNASSSHRRQLLNCFSSSVYDRVTKYTQEKGAIVKYEGQNGFVHAKQSNNTFTMSPPGNINLAELSKAENAGKFISSQLNSNCKMNLANKYKSWRSPPKDGERALVTASGNFERRVWTPRSEQFKSFQLASSSSSSCTSFTASSSYSNGQFGHVKVRNGASVIESGPHNNGPSRISGNNDSQNAKSRPFTSRPASTCTSTSRSDGQRAVGEGEKLFRILKRGECDHFTLSCKSSIGIASHVNSMVDIRDAPAGKVTAATSNASNVTKEDEQGWREREGQSESEKEMAKKMSIGTSDDSTHKSSVASRSRCAIRFDAVA